MLNGGKTKKKKKYIQFVTIFYLLKHGRPVTNFDMKELFKFLKYIDAPKKLDILKWVGNGTSHAKCGFETNESVFATNQIHFH
jgi:hypothetical protein